MKFFSEASIRFVGGTRENENELDGAISNYFLDIGPELLAAYQVSEVAPNFSTGTTKDQIAAGQRAYTMSS